MEHTFAFEGTFLNRELNVALDGVRRSAALCRRVQSRVRKYAVEKPDRSPVTLADFAVQAIVSEALEKSFPLDPLVGEEDTKLLIEGIGPVLLEQVTDLVRMEITGARAPAVLGWIRRGMSEPLGRFWTLDPIDGTKGFLRGEQYAIALALIEDGQVAAAVLGCPRLDGRFEDVKAGSGVLVAARKGFGAWWIPMEGKSAWKPLHVSRRNRMSEAVVLRSFEENHTDGERIQRLMSLQGVIHPPIHMDSLAKYAVLAAGRGDVLIRMPPGSKSDYKEYIWDQAAGVLIIEEAGGRVTDLDQRPLNFSCGRKLTQNRGVVATNGLLHAAVFSALKSV